MSKSPRQLLATANLRPKRRLGQNFLTSADTAEMLVRRSQIDPEDIILEIGAGLGAFTIFLAQTAKKVYAVEKDQILVPILESELAANHLDNVTVIAQDILSVDLHQLPGRDRRKITVVGNLPYNISSQVLIKLIASRGGVNRAVLMFQKELARRLTARPGTRDYGRITVMLQYCARVRSLAVVSAACFYPKPKVDSELVEILFKTDEENAAREESVLFSVVKAAFSKRRKTLKNALAGSTFSSTAECAGKLLVEADIDPTRRAETLSVAEFVKLSNLISAKGQIPRP